jgi:hypothetical protein
MVIFPWVGSRSSAGWQDFSLASPLEARQKIFRGAKRFELRAKMLHAPDRVNILEKSLNPPAGSQYQ